MATNTTTMPAMTHPMHGMNLTTMMPGMNHSTHGGHNTHHATNHTVNLVNNTICMMMKHCSHGMDNTSHGGNHGMNHEMNHSVHGVNHDSEHPMKMYFHAGKDVTLFFEDWVSNENKDLVAMIIVLFLLGVIYEGLKVGRQILLTRALAKSSYEVKQGIHDVHIRSPTAMPICSSAHVLQTFLHMVQVFLGYLLMLAFMTYNVWLCIAVIVGSGLGYFMFGWKTSTIVSSGDHCN